MFLEPNNGMFTEVDHISRKMMTNRLRWTRESEELGAIDKTDTVIYIVECCMEHSDRHKGGWNRSVVGVKTTCVLCSHRTHGE